LAWFGRHKQRLAYALVAVAMVVVTGAATWGGFRLHHSAEIERQALRTEELGSAAFRLQDILQRAQTNKGVDQKLAVERRGALTAAAAALGRIRSHDSIEADRLEGPYRAYLQSSSRAFARVSSGGALPLAQQRGLERRLARLQTLVAAEIGREARASRVANPRARFALIVAAVAAVILVGLLIWQFEMERRAGRIDRDNARRSEELVRLRDEFVASVSHELRTPLTSILGYLDLIREKEAGSTPTEDGAFLEVVARNADRLLRLVSDLLLIAEIEGGTLALQTRDVDLGSLAAECVETAKPNADAKQIELTLRQEEPAQLTADPLRLSQMMDNIVANAIKFTPAKGRVTVTTSSSNGRVLFRVTDSGPGIDEEELSQLFEPFFRTQAAVAGGVKGTGLGLTITKAIVEAHRGSISVASTPGGGTTFRVELPRER
jgi:signal transduction histidine kinase